MQTQPAEDLDAVLGRFQTWAGTQNAVETKPGIRELSHEEALQSSRYRWQGANKAPLKKKLVSVAAPIASAEPNPVKLKTAPVKVRDAKQKAAKKVRARNHAAKTSPTAKTETKPGFREVLAETIRPTQIMTEQSSEITRQAVISIRLAPRERALIRTRATEAGITASAYIRQCTLEVEQLREQVQQTLAAIERTPPASVSIPTPAPGFFSRLAQRIFSGRNTTIALRA